MSVRSAWVITWLTMAGLAACASGYRLVEPFETLSHLALIPFVLLAFDIRRALGEKQFRAMFAGFAICLLPNYRSDAVVRSVPPEFQALVGLLVGGMLLYLLWHFSVFADSSDPHAREKMFGKKFSESPATRRV